MKKMLFLSFFLLVIALCAESSQNLLKTIEKTSYSDKLYIFTNDGRIYSYSLNKREIDWIVDLNIRFINWNYKKNNPMEEDSYFFPTLDGNFIFYSKYDGYYKLDRDELDEILNVCYNKPNEKIFTYLKEKIILIDRSTGTFLELDQINEDPKFLALEFGDIENFLVFKLQQKILKNVDLKIFTENWQIVSSTINLFSYKDFMINSSNLNKKNEEKAHPDITIIKSSDTNLNIMRNSDHKIIFSLETEEEIVFVYSQDENDNYYRNLLATTFHFLEQDLIKKFITKDEQKIIKVYNSNDGSSTSLAVYKTNYHDDLCVYSNKCLSPSLTHFSKLNNENLESDMLKCMIDIRNKQKILPFIPKNISNNVTYCTNEEYNQNFNISTLQITIFLTIILIFSSILIYYIFFLRKRAKSIDIDIQVNQKSIEKHDNPNKNVEKIKASPKKTDFLKEPSLFFKSNINIDKNSILGFGANGTIVYLGLFQNREVAIKRIIAHKADLANQEMEILLKLDHPNIIKFYYYEDQKDFLYLALEKCECNIAEIMSFVNDSSEFKKNKKNKGKIEFISSFLQKKKFLGKPLIKGILLQATKGLRYLHSQNIMHRDIKPENILVSKGKTIKLADFSMSKDMKLQENYITNDLGTLGWRAKEVILNEVKSFSADVFALGCIFYYIYTQGKHPFGELHERETNIIKDKWNKDFIENDCLFHDLIKKMLNSSAEARPNLGEVINHPFFWTDDEKLTFICDLSDFLEANDAKFSEYLEDWATKNNIMTKTFDKEIDIALFRDLVSFRKYNFSSIKDLIRIIRNKRNHYYNLAYNIKIMFNNSIEGIYVYFEEKYPKLFIRKIKLRNYSSLNNQKMIEKNPLNLDSYSEGFQVLREYIIYSNLNFLKLCQEFDSYDSKCLSKDSFKNALKISPLYFTPSNIEQIYQDSPKNDKREILYYTLSQMILKGPKPKTRFSFKNLYNLKRTEKMIRNEKDLNMEIEYDIGNFFDRKKKFDFKHHELFKLELIYLRKSETLEDEAQSFEDREMKKQLKEFYKMNNQLILENFQTYCAREITVKFQPNYPKVQIVDEILEGSFCKFFGLTEKKKYEMIVNEDFKIMMVKLKMELTSDEMELLRYLIFQSTEFTAFNAKVFLLWLNGRRIQRIKDLIKINAPEIKLYPERTFPKILKNLVTLCYNFGTNFLTTSLGPFLYEKSKLDLESLKTFLRTANIDFDKEEFLQFQFYLANNHYLSLDDYENLERARFYIDIANLLKCIKDNFKLLHLEDKEQNNYVSEKNALHLTSQGIFQQTLNLLEKKLNAYCDDAFLIDEIKLRTLIATEYPLINQNALNYIFQQMNNNIPVNQFSGFQKVFLPEFIEILRKGTLEGFKESSPEKTKKINVETKKPVEKTNQKIEKTSGFVKSAINFSKTADMNYGASLQRIYHVLQNKKIEENTRDKLSVAVIYPLLQLCKAKDYLQDGTIKLDHFKKILEDEFGILTEDIYHLISMAETIAGIEKKDSYGFSTEKAISYLYFCMQLEKTFILQKTLAVTL